MDLCPRCYSKVPLVNNRPPPWCPTCGIDLKPAATNPGPEPASQPGPSEQRLDPTTVKQMVEEIVGPDPSKGPPLSRAYRHLDCGGMTRVSGDDYVLLECPFRPVTGTFCCGCNDFVPLERVEWEDTGERISDYRRRVKASVGFWRGLYLEIFANAYEGAINLKLDSKGKPLGGNRTGY